MLDRISRWALCACLVIASPAAADLAEDCAQNDDLTLKNGACTRIIEAGAERHVMARAFNNRGYGHRLSGNLDAALADYASAIETDANYPLAYANRGTVHYLRGQAEEALSDFNWALELAPDNTGVLTNRGFANRALGYPLLAIRDWEEAIRIDGKPRIERWQTRLRRAGLYRGKVTGTYDSPTRRALHACARDLAC